MPKISVNIEAETAAEYQMLVYALFHGQHSVSIATTERIFAEEDAKAARDVQSGTHGIKQDDEPVQPLTDIQRDIQEGTFGVASADGREEKKARKPRGPNKPKMAPVVEEAFGEDAEVEHVGTVAVGTRKVEEEKPAVTERVPEGNGEVLTRTDLGDTIAGYVRKYGINFAQTDVSKMLQDMFGADVRKKSDVPEDQPSLRKAITTITQATIDNPYNRKVDVNG